MHNSRHHGIGLKTPRPQPRAISFCSLSGVKKVRQHCIQAVHCAILMPKRHHQFPVWQASLVEANSHKGSDGFRPQQSGRDSMLRLAALSASLQDIVGRPWRGQTNDIFGLVILRPLLQSGSSMLTTRQSMIQLEPCTFGRLSWGQGADL